MINAVYDRAHNRLTVEGHAASGPKGEDLVCSAATILVHTLEANVQYMERAGIVVEMEADVREGHAQIGCKASRGYAHTVASAFQTVCVGFEILADKFPEYISFDILG